MLRELDRGLWVIDHDFEMPGGIEMGARTTVVRLDDDGLLLHSPGPLTEAEIAELRALGPVRALLAPNLFHHLFIEATHEAFPDALLFAVDGIAAKVPALDFGALGAEPDPLWKGVLEQQPIEGVPRVGEVVFFHPPSRSLLLADLCFNLHAARRRRTRFFLQIMNAWGRFGPSRLLRSMIKDRAALRRNIDAVLEWDFERVIVTHGEVLESGGREALREAFAFLD